MTALERFERERRNVGDGWQPLVTDVHAHLIELLGDYELLQIKEKFGGLRYYWNPLDDATVEAAELARQITEEAEARSVTICEECGIKGKNQADHGWYHTFCTRHRREHNARRAREITELQGKADA